MLHSILFYINGQRFQRADAAVFVPLTEFLREQLRLPGTKVVCAEGACGACTVLVGRPHGGGLRYQAMNACLLPLYQIAGSHVITVEGVSNSPALSTVQDAMVSHHGTQCGFCTPGMVMSLTAHMDNGSTDDALPASLCGNLCRCTGYLSILEAGRAIDRAAIISLDELYPPREMVSGLADSHAQSVQIETAGRRLFLPATLQDACRMKRACPDAAVVAGGTELGVQWGRDGQTPADILSLTLLPCAVRVEQNTLAMDAAASWTQVEEAAREHFPELARLLSRFGAAQIKNAGTVGGQVVQNSPIGDALPLFAVLGARVEIVGTDGRRDVPIDQFLQDGAFVLNPDELVGRVFLPLPRTGQLFRLAKVSRRSGFDRSVVSAALLVTMDGGHIADAALAFGGVGPRVQRTPRTEAFLLGRPLNEATLCAAGDVLRGEIAPADDVRGSGEYRLLLAANLLLRLLDEPEGAA